MPKIIVNAPKPVEPPPSTYTVTLSEEEFLALRSLVARRDNKSISVLEQLRLQMWAVSRGKISPFKIEQTTLRLAAYHIRKKTESELASF